MTTKKLHLPLPQELHEALFEESRALGLPATRLVRRILDRWLQQRRKIRQKEEIRRFAEQWAGTPVDLDVELEETAVEELLHLPNESR
jgi:hypothetical protein